MTTDHTSGSIPDREVGSHLRVPQNWQFHSTFTFWILTTTLGHRQSRGTYPTLYLGKLKPYIK